MQLTYGSAADWATEIRRFRRQHLVKQATLAEMIGVDQATVSRWESGRTAPTLPVQHRLRDLIGRAVADDALLRHWTDTTIHSVVLSDDRHIIVAASAAYENGHGLPPRTARGRSTTPTYTAESLSIRRMAGERGFFRGNVASLSIVSRGNSLCGRRRDIGLKVVWTPARRDDGRTLIRSERLELDEMQFAQALAGNGGPVRFTMMDDLVA